MIDLKVVRRNKRGQPKTVSGSEMQKRQGNRRETGTVQGGTGLKGKMNASDLQKKYHPASCVCVFIFIKLHITAQSGPAILAILCHSH